MRRAPPRPARHAGAPPSPQRGAHLRGPRRHCSALHRQQPALFQTSAFPGSDVPPPAPSRGVRARESCRRAALRERGASPSPHAPRPCPAGSSARRRSRPCQSGGRPAAFARPEGKRASETWRQGPAARPGWRREGERRDRPDAEETEVPPASQRGHHPPRRAAGEGETFGGHCPL